MDQEHVEFYLSRLTPGSQLSLELLTVVAQTESDCIDLNVQVVIQGQGGHITEMSLEPVLDKLEHVNCR